MRYKCGKFNNKYSNHRIVRLKHMVHVTWCLLIRRNQNALLLILRRSARHPKGSTWPNASLDYMHHLAKYVSGLTASLGQMRHLVTSVTWLNSSLRPNFRKNLFWIPKNRMLLLQVLRRKYKKSSEKSNVSEARKRFLNIVTRAYISIILKTNIDFRYSISLL